MAFVIDGSGSIKMLKKTHWIECIRLAAPTMKPTVNSYYEPVRSKGKRKHHKSAPRQMKKEEWCPPSIISFIPTSLSDDGDESTDNEDSIVSYRRSIS